MGLQETCLDRYKRSHLMLAGTLALIALIGVLGYLIGE